jgi:Protein of unknown function (DUF3667)
MKKRVKSIECANCHYHFDQVNNFCPNCGQENHTHKLPVHHFLYEFVESLTHFDTKVFRTFKDMVAKPGLVIKNYNSNKRARYVPPARIYVFMSFIFFFLLSLLTNSDIKENTKKIDEQLKSNVFNGKYKTGGISFISTTKLDSITFSELSKLDPLTNKRIDSFIVAKGGKTDWFNTRVIHTMVKLYKGEIHTIDIYQKFIKYISYSLLIFMPFFALILKLFYRKKAYYYSEFLVFSIYFHTFIFLLLSLFTLFTRYIYDSKNILLVVFLLLLVYLGFSLKRVFQQGIGKTILKTTLISILYFVTLGFLVVLMLLSSIL